MAFHLVRGPLPAAIRDVVAEQLTAAAAELCGETDLDWDAAVHSARKRFKQVRSVLRLVRDELGAEVERRERTALRDAGRRLSPARDAAVLLHTLEEVVGSSSFRPVRQDLADRAEAIRSQAVAAGAARAVAEDVREARDRVAAWPLVRDDVDVLAGGLARGYRSGRRRMRAAYGDPDNERFHEWRKRVKDLWYHLRLLEPAWPPVLGAMVEEAHRLSDLLGDDHDLRVLAATVRSEGLGTAPERDALAPVLAARGQTLRRQARALGGRLYVESPRDFAGRVTAYWQRWRDDGDG